MNDKLFYSLAGLAAVAMIALSLLWPQGLGSRSPKPFGHALIQPDVVRMERERAERDAQHKRDQIIKTEQKAREQAERDEVKKTARPKITQPTATH